MTFSQRLLRLLLAPLAVGLLAALPHIANAKPDKKYPPEITDFSIVVQQPITAGSDLDFTLEGTPRGQIEAGRSLAMNEWQVFMRVVLPPALGRVWPAMVSQIVIVMLGSAVCGQIAAQELSYTANLIQSRNFRSFESFIVATLIYLAMSVAVRQALYWAGRRFIFGR